jgi:hypothetical protein
LKRAGGRARTTQAWMSDRKPVGASLRSYRIEWRLPTLRWVEPAIHSRPMGCMVLTVLGMVAEIELGFIRDWQRACIDAAKAKGIYKGRPATFDRAHRRPAQRRDGSDRKSPEQWAANAGTYIRRQRPQGSPRRAGAFASAPVNQLGFSARNSLTLKRCTSASASAISGISGVSEKLRASAFRRKPNSKPATPSCSATATVTCCAATSAERP